jgi:hypothetical protein
MGMHQRARPMRVAFGMRGAATVMVLARRDLDENLIIGC